MTDTIRMSDFPIDPLFMQRWSPRAFSSDPMPEADLSTMLEAARWAPSSSNIQPWRFSYALRDTPDWDRYVGFLMEGNQIWAKNASALVVAISKTHHKSSPEAEERFNPSHSFDTGAASLAFQLQAIKLGYHAHPMGGIFKDKIKLDLAIPLEGYAVEAAIAVGRLAPKDTLPEPLRSREGPSQRKPLSDVAFKGGFKI